MGTTNITMSRGDRLDLTLRVTLSKSPYDLTGCSLWFTAKQSYVDADAAAIIQKTVGSGITVTDAQKGIAAIVVLPADTEDLDGAKVNLYWDVQLETASGDVWTIVKGNLIINPDVTTARA
jgi:hypothetical protein